jgi:hypothetical protein
MSAQESSNWTLPGDVSNHATQELSNWTLPGDALNHADNLALFAPNAAPPAFDFSAFGAGSTYDSDLFASTSGQTLQESSAPWYEMWPAHHNIYPS